MLPAAPGAAAAAAGAAAADPAAPADAAPAQEPHQLGNVALPPGVAADLLAQTAAAGALGQQLGGVSPPALFLGANPGYSRLGFGDLCQRFVEEGYSPGASLARLAAVYAFSEREGVPLAEPPPGGRQRRRSTWTGCFPGFKAWSKGFLDDYGFYKAQATFESKDGRYKVTGHKFVKAADDGTVLPVRLYHFFNLADLQGRQAAQQLCKQLRAEL